MLKGKKTYIVGIAGLIWAGAGWFMGWLEPATAQGMIIMFLGMLGLRNALPTE